MKKQSLGIKSSTVTAFLNDKLTPEQCKNCKKLSTLIQSCIEKYSSIEVNLNLVQIQFGPEPKFKDIINVCSKNKRPIKT